MSDENRGASSFLPASVQVWDFMSDAPSDNTKRALFNEVQRLYGAPRDNDFLLSYLKDEIPLGRCFLYGAGTQSRFLLDHVKQLPFSVEGIIDQNAEVLGQLDMLPVLTPEEFVQRYGQASMPVLVCHPSREGDMVDTLRQIVEKRDIFPVFSSEEYASKASRLRDVFLEQNQRVLDAQRDVLIISTMAADLSIYPYQNMIDLFGADRILNAIYGRPESRIGAVESHKTGDIDYVDTMFCLDMLADVIDRVRPKLIFTTLSPHVESEHLSIWLGYKYPDVARINQFYDMSGLLGDRRLKRSFGHSEKTIRRNRYGNYMACNDSTANLFKNGGQDWRRFATSFVACDFSYFPEIGDPGPMSVARRVEGTVKIIFAGSIPQNLRVEGGLLHPDNNYLEYFRILNGAERIELDIFNRAHVSEKEDVIFQEYIEQFGSETGNIRYHRNISHEELMAIMPSYDIAWMVTHTDNLDDVEPISRVAIANKFASYLAAGVPVIIDECFDYMRDLVVEYGAGIIVRYEDRFRMTDMILDFDCSVARTNVARLHGFLRQENRASLKAFEDLMTQAVSLSKG